MRANDRSHFDKFWWGRVDDEIQQRWPVMVWIVSGWRLYKLREGSWVEELGQPVINRVGWGARWVEVATYQKAINCIRSQIGKEQAELIKEHWFAGRRWAINVCQHNITRFETNVYQLELERCVRKVVVSRWDVDWFTVDNGKATASSLVRVFSVNMCNSITRWCWVIFDHWGHPIWPTFRLVPGGTGRCLQLGCGVLVPYWTEREVDWRWRAGIDFDSPDD